MQNSQKNVGSRTNTFSNLIDDCSEDIKPNTQKMKKGKENEKLKIVKLV